jgi:hypothetical protein
VIRPRFTGPSSIWRYPVLDELIDAIMAEISDELKGYISEFGNEFGPGTEEDFVTEIRKDITIKVTTVLDKYGIKY